MAYYFLLLITIIFILMLSKLLFDSDKRRRCADLPPSPPSLPFIGHLHLLKEPIHRTLQTLSKQYGPIYFLSIGVRKTIVVSSPSLAEECFVKNDVVFANRPKSTAGKILHYNYTTVGAASYSPHWRNLRRLTAVELLSTARLNSFVHIRQDEVRLLIRNLFNKVSEGPSGKLVEMKTRLSGLSMNVVMRMVAGKRYFGTEEVDDKEGEDEGKRFQDVIGEVFELSVASNPADCFPVLRWFGDLTGMEKRMRSVLAKFDGFFQGLIDERRDLTKTNMKDSTGRTMIDTFLELQESDPDTYSDDIIKGQVMALITAGTDTTSGTLEWAMSLLLNNPDILNKARAELDNVVGTNRLVDESDYPKLPYLQSIISETFRLYPVAPLLVPHNSSEDCTIGGYHIPKDTMLMVNAWAIHRDSNVWEDPTTFRPERHDKQIGVAASDAYKLIPFGMGRRACPGTGLANRVLSVALGALIQCFEWERDGEELLDMSEGQGLTMPKAKPLEAVCKVRECMRGVLENI
ncbi:Cytochrome P450 81Q32 [Linum grandiflorum]